MGAPESSNAIGTDSIAATPAPSAFTLLTAGARPRRLRLHGPQSLTSRERRIAALAADGLTNKRIAETIFLSEKTVELHLRNAYEKLGKIGRASCRERAAL